MAKVSLQVVPTIYSVTCSLTITKFSEVRNTFSRAADIYIIVHGLVVCLRLHPQSLLVTYGVCIHDSLVKRHHIQYKVI